MKFSVVADAAVPPERARVAYADPAFYEGRPAAGDISIEGVVGHRTEGARTTLEVRYRFTGSVSPAVRAVVDPAKLSWVTRTVFEGSGPARFSVQPDHYPDRLSCSGSFHFAGAQSGPGATRVQIDGEVKVRVLLVGRTVEQVIVTGLRAYLNDEVARLAGFASGG